MPKTYLYRNENQTGSKLVGEGYNNILEVEPEDRLEPEALLLVPFVIDKVELSDEVAVVAVEMEVDDVGDGL